MTDNKGNSNKTAKINAKSSPRASVKRISLNFEPGANGTNIIKSFINYCKSTRQNEIIGIFTKYVN